MLVNSLVSGSFLVALISRHWTAWPWCLWQYQVVGRAIWTGRVDATYWAWSQKDALILAFLFRHCTLLALSMFRGSGPFGSLLFLWCWRLTVRFFATLSVPRKVVHSKIVAREFETRWENDLFLHTLCRGDADAAWSILSTVAEQVLCENSLSHTIPRDAVVATHKASQHVYLWTRTILLTGGHRFASLDSVAMACVLRS